MFSTKFAELLKSHGLTRSQYAEKVDTTVGHVSHLTTGRRKPSYEEIQKIAKHFPDVDLNELLRENEVLSELNRAEEEDEEFTTSDKYLKLLEYHSTEIKSLVKKLQSVTN